MTHISEAHLQEIDIDILKSQLYSDIARYICICQNVIYVYTYIPFAPYTYIRFSKVSSIVILHPLERRRDPYVGDSYIRDMAQSKKT